MRHFAITGIVTTFWMPSIIDGSLMRATPPSRRMSDGHALERHHGRRARVLGDLRLLGRDDVHDDAAAQHLREPALDACSSGCALCDHAAESTDATRGATSPISASTARSAGGSTVTV